MTRLSDALVLAGFATLAAALPAVVIAGPAAGLHTAGIGIALCIVGGIVGAVGAVMQR